MRTVYIVLITVSTLNLVGDDSQLSPMKVDIREYLPLINNIAIAINIPFLFGGGLLWVVGNEKGKEVVGHSCVALVLALLVFILRSPTDMQKITMPLITIALVVFSWAGYYFLSPKLKRIETKLLKKDER